MRQISPDHELDITAETCPMTYVRTRLALEQLLSGQILAVRLRGQDPQTNVPRTALQQGHDVIAIEPAPEGAVIIYLRRA